ncbi:ATP-dependent RNA helicase DRS1 [Babesia microti strain RI]|uniref:ATP-dependent RNA helicase n=1 Tax=Babesia microti (strain RI) TaxID=1133968 RepID=A0A1R4AA51_BABMR|nr:ATP-dependent RNA helicase DRS1 [Babesia microti strain RI]SJK85882.1 ATP-dependent RNA helicase DRS1 [Babesia microti strain RI]|eukprot:XP_021338093.1 ATP-dependent RNA helicase DRS1 [Babesia microti strain RI]
MSNNTTIPLWIKRICNIDNYHDHSIRKVSLESNTICSNGDSQVLVTSNGLNFSLNEHLLECLSKKFHRLFPIQRAVIPHLSFDLNDQYSPLKSDIVVWAPTGQGKTLCYVIPILNSLSKHKLNIHSVNSIIVTPSRELAHQVHSIFDKFIPPIDTGSFLSKVKITSCVGKLMMKKFEKKTKSNCPDVLISTFGMLDIFSKYFTNIQDSMFHSVKWIIVDEIDAIINRDTLDCILFLNAISNQYNTKKINDVNCTKEGGQKVFLSATLSLTSDLVSHFHLKNPILFTSLSSNLRLSPNLQQYYIHSNVKNRSKRLLEFLHSYIFNSNKKHYKLLIFSNTVQLSHIVSRLLQLYNKLFLKKAKFKVLEFTRNLTAESRDKLFKRFRNKKRACLICSDVISRGIDVSDVNCVINYGKPKDIETYIHRVGRTARVQCEGIAVTIASKDSIDNINTQLLSRNCELKQYYLSTNFDEIFSSSKYSRLMSILNKCLEYESAGKLKLDDKINSDIYEQIANQESD